MSAFDIAAILLGIAALTGYLNHRVLKLPATSGTLAVALLSSLAIVSADRFIPGLALEQSASAFLGEIDFNEALMHGMLSFLLFDGALHVDLEGLLDHKWTIAALATLGVVVSTAVIGVLTWGVFGAIGLDVPFVVCLIFGALISPTDPIAVMGLLKELHAPRSLEAQIAGESLFNDGIGVVVFMATVSLAGFAGAAEPTAVSPNVGSLLKFLALQVIGGAGLGLGLG